MCAIASFIADVKSSFPASGLFTVNRPGDGISRDSIVGKTAEIQCATSDSSDELGTNTSSFR